MDYMNDYDEYFYHDAGNEDEGDEIKYIRHALVFGR